MVAVMALAIVAGSSLFGDDKVAPAKVRRNLPTYWSRLNLSLAQRTKVLTIQAEYDAKIDALEQQIKKLQDEQRREMAKVLTAEQRARLREIIAAKVGDVPPEKEEKKRGAGKKP
jgi:hypothetical protein